MSDFVPRSSIGNLTQIRTRLHSDLQSVAADQHHDRSHALDSGSDHTGTITQAQLPSGAVIINEGSYTGDDGVNRAVAHGLGRLPKVIIISSLTGGPLIAFIIAGQAKIFGFHSITGVLRPLDVAAPDSTYFYVGNATAIDSSMNADTYSYTFEVLG